MNKPRKPPLSRRNVLKKIVNTRRKKLHQNPKSTKKLIDFYESHLELLKEQKTKINNMKKNKRLTPARAERLKRLQEDNELNIREMTQMLQNLRKSEKKS